MSSDRVTIVGGGLSAIYAFMGCIDSGIDPKNIDVLLSARMPTIGCVFMYSCPLPFPRLDIVNILLGTCDYYAEKQWKMGKRITSAHRRFNEGYNRVVYEHLWDPQTVIPLLWDLVPNVYPVVPLPLPAIELLKLDNKAVICTFPDKLKRQEYISTKSLTTFPISICKSSSTGYSVIYNGLDYIPWVRQTMVPGKVFTEYPYYCPTEDVKKFEIDRGNDLIDIVPAPDIFPGTDPLTSEERREGNLLRVGRMSVFDRGYLSHQAQEETKNFLESL